MTVLVLGSGYLGTALAVRCPDAVHTSREPANRSADRRWLRLDVADKSTWGALDGLIADVVIVAAPMTPEYDLEALWKLLATISSRVVMVGATSAFGNAGVVTDDSLIDPMNPRAAAEERLRIQGAAVIHASGIYGPGRNPLDWVRRGRIANAGKLVNLVHVDDLARACLFLGETYESGLRVVCSDGTPRRWRDILAEAVVRGWIADPHLPDEEDPSSKRVVPQELIRRGFRFAHADLSDELQRLEGSD